MSFFRVALVWIAFFAISYILIMILGEAFEYIIGLAGLAILVFVIFFRKGSGNGDDNFPEPPDFD